MNHPTLLSALSALLLVLVPAPASAQTRSRITGTVTDVSQAVLPGVTVTLESPDLVGAAQTFTTEAYGVYRFVDLPPGVYQITAALAGFQTVKRGDLRLLFATTLTIDLTLPVGGTTETLVVVGRAPAVDVTTSQSTSKVDADLIQSTPTVTDPRNGLEILAMSPGINFRSALGGARDANEILLDGTSTTLPERQGTNAAVVNPNWMEEVQVVSLGASAEYGEFSGTVANFVTRSGSSQFHGLAEYRTVRPSWLGDNTESLTAALRTRFNNTKVITQWDSSAHAGGPLVRDRLFFFTGYQSIRNDTQAAGVPAPNGQKQWRALGKLNWAASKDLKIDASVQSNKVILVGGASTTSTADVGTVNTEPNTVWTARAIWSPGPTTLVEIRTGGLAYQQTIDPKIGGRTGPPPRRDTVTGISSVNGATYRFLDEDRRSVGGSVMRYASNVLGKAHELKVGGDFQHVGFYSESGYPSGLSFTDRGGVPDQVSIWAGDIQSASGNRTTFYVQDGWKLNDRLTLEPGFRVTLNRGRTPTAGNVYTTNPVSPRFGLAWDVTPDHKTVVRAHAGRYHEAFGTIEYQFTDTAGRTPQITARVLGPDNYQEINRLTPANNQFVASDIRQAALDQYLVGAERELFSDFSVKVQYIHRKFEDLFGWIDTKSIYVPVQMRDSGPDAVANTADDGSMFTVFNLTNPGVGNQVFTNPDGAWRRYRALQLIAQKRFSKNWQILAGYTRSRAEGSVNNNIVDNYGGATVTANPFINPNNAINATGRNTLDFTHELVARGSYQVTRLGGFTVGGVYRYISGQALSRTAVFRLTQGNTTIRVEPRGSLPTDATSQADMRFDKTFPLGPKSRLSVYLDVFNINNQGVATGYTEASGASLGVPSGWSTPRTFQLSGRVTF